MNYFVLSSKVERGCPISLVEDARLYDKFYDDLKTAPEFGLFPWYAASKTCALPLNACLISKSRLYEFDIRKRTDSIYVISDLFVSLAKDIGVTFLDAQPVSVRSRKGKKISSKEYFIVRFREEPFESVALLESSKYDVDLSHFVLEKIAIKPDCQLHLFLIQNVAPIQHTFFCSELFLESAKKHDIKGINFFKCDEAPWQDPNNFLNFLIQDDYSTDKEIWPI